MYGFDPDFHKKISEGGLNPIPLEIPDTMATFPFYVYVRNNMKL
jgi:hypothetical protein